MAIKALPLVLCVAFLVAGVVNGLDEPGRRLLQVPSRTRPSWTTTNTQTNTGTQTNSGSSGSSGASAGSSASSTGGSASASSSANGAVIQAAAAACASACAEAYAEANVCSAGEWSLGRADVVAIACAKAAAKVVLESRSETSASGNSQACANSQSSANAYGAALARAAADAIAEASGHCTAVQTYVYSEAFAQVFVSVCAQAYTSACSVSSGYGSTEAEASVHAQLSVMASAMSRAFAQVYAEACASHCSGYSSCVGACPYASYTTSSYVETLAQITDGRFAVTRALADAQANVCGDHNYGAFAQSLGETCINVCLKAYGCLHSEVSATPGSHACAGVLVHAELKAIVGAAVDLVANAYAANWGATCAEAVSYVSGAIGLNNRGELSESLTRIIIDAHQHVCSNGAGSYELSALIDIVKSNWSFIQACADASADARASCLCQHPGCCSSCNYMQTCPALA